MAKIGTQKTNDTVLYLNTNMDAGHGGASGRFEALKELAKEYVFLLDLEQIKKWYVFFVKFASIELK